jgi:tetratricopeptide (TPR) repeat protein
LDHHDVGLALMREAHVASTRRERVETFQRAAREHELAAKSGDWRPLLSLATIALVLGSHEEALAMFERAQALAPGEALSQLGKVECLLAAGRSVEAMSLVQPWLDNSPDGWVLAAFAAESAGLLEQMRELTAGAERCLLSEPFRAPHRQERLDDLRALCGIIAGAPRSDGRGPVAQLAALMAGHPARVPGADVRDIDVGVLYRAIQQVLVSGHAQLIVPLLDAPAEEVWPGVSEIVNGAIVALAGGASVS